MVKQKSFRIGQTQFEKLKRIVPSPSKNAKIFKLERGDVTLLEVWVDSPDKTERREQTLVITCMRFLDSKYEYEVKIYPQKIDSLPEELKLKVRAILSSIDIFE